MYRISRKFPLVPGTRMRNVAARNSIEKHAAARYYSSGSHRKSGWGKPVFLLLGLTATTAGSAVAYAKFDPSFRKKLEEFVPGSDAFIKFILQEEKSYVDFIGDYASDKAKGILASAYSLVGWNVASTPKHSKMEENSKFVAPKSEGKTSPKSAKEGTDAVEISDKSSSKKEETVEKYDEERDKGVKPKVDILELEKRAENAARSAIVAYNYAREILRDYREKVAYLVEESTEKEDTAIWVKIKEMTVQKDDAIRKAEGRAADATQDIIKFKTMVDEETLTRDEDLRANVRENIRNILDDVAKVEAALLSDINNASSCDKYWKKVQEAKATFSNELGDLFPNLSTEELTDEELELFVMYSCQLIRFYQKELKKSETIGTERINKILESSKGDGTEVVSAAVAFELEKERKKVAQELMKAELKMKLDFEKEMRRIMKMQADAHSDHLEEVIRLKDEEFETRLKWDYDARVEEITINYNRQLARIIGRMKGLDTAIESRLEAEKKAKNSQMLWNACQALMGAITSDKTACQCEPQPLQLQVNAISKAAVEGDELVAAVLNAIPREAVTKGVYSENALKERFLKVERTAFRMANVPDGYVTLFAVFFSYLQSFLIIVPKDPIPKEELADEPVDTEKFNNYDVLCRARYWLDRGDYMQTLRYMNLLKGAAASVAKDWIADARVFLETQQAAKTLLQYAVYCSLLLQNVGNGNES